MTACLDEILQELENGRKTMDSQTQVISEILRSSNNVLLQVEAGRLRHDTATEPEPTNVFNYQRRLVPRMAEIIQHYGELQDGVKPNETNFNAYIETTKERVEYLCSAVRKVLAVRQCVNEMVANLLMEEDNDNELSEKTFPLEYE